MSPSFSLTPGDHRRTIHVGERERSYLLHVPHSYDGTQRLPLVLAFHGGATDASYMIRFCGLNETADRENFLAVYPNGTGELPKLLTWNAGNCCGYARRHNADDVGFVRAILDELAGTGMIDRRRVFATGMSNGAMMAYRLAAEMSDRIAAIAPVAGTMELDALQPSRPVSVIHFHGTANEFVPFDGAAENAACRSTISAQSKRRFSAGWKSMAVGAIPPSCIYPTSGPMACRLYSRSSAAAATAPRSCSTQSMGAVTHGPGARRVWQRRSHDAQHLG